MKRCTNIYYSSFTLLEILIYSAIVGSLIAAVSVMALQAYHGYTKNLNYQILQNQARFTMNKIENEIVQANGINISDSIFNSDTGKLSLKTANTNTNPTIFQIESDFLTIKRGSQSSIRLTDESTRVRRLRFENLTSNKTSGTIKITLQLEYKNEGNRPQLNASITLISTVNLRKSP